MNTMTINDIISEASARSAMIPIGVDPIKTRRALIIVRQSDVAVGLRDRGIIRFFDVGDNKNRAFRISAIQYMKFSDIDDSEMNNSVGGPYRNWVDFLREMEDEYAHFSASEIMALIWIGEEIVL